jgi:hypothetical protein
MSSRKTKDTADTKPRKVKLVRDSFCMPKDEYALIDGLKARALTLGKAVKKSELLRAGVLWLNAAQDPDLLAAIGKVESLKTGRPARSETPPEVPTTATPQAKAKPAPTPTPKPATKRPARAARAARTPAEAVAST